jgi:hypothetical protein
MYGPPPRTDRRRGVGEVCQAVSATVEVGSSISDFDPPAPPEIEATPVGVGSFSNTARIPVRELPLPPGLPELGRVLRARPKYHEAGVDNTL